jgi:hypothetical protein
MLKCEKALNKERIVSSTNGIGTKTNSACALSYVEAEI